MSHLILISVFFLAFNSFFFCYILFSHSQSILALILTLFHSLPHLRPYLLLHSSLPTSLYSFHFTFSLYGSFSLAALFLFTVPPPVTFTFSFSPLYLKDLSPCPLSSSSPPKHSLHTLVPHRLLSYFPPQVLNLPSRPLHSFAF